MSAGYIRFWRPLSKTGSIHGCQGAGQGQNIPFLFEGINDKGLRDALAARPGFQLDKECDQALQPPDTLRVTFEVDSNGDGFADNILPKP